MLQFWQALFFGALLLAVSWKSVIFAIEFVCHAAEWRCTAFSDKISKLLL